MTDRDINHSFEDDKVILNTSQQMKERQPILSDFIDGLEIDIEKLMEMNI